MTVKTYLVLIFLLFALPQQASTQQSVTQQALPQQALTQQALPQQIVTQKNYYELIKQEQSLLFKKYLLKSCDSIKKTEEDEEDSSDSSCDSGFFSGLKTECENAKQSATKCCENPNACNSLVADLVKHVLPVLPSIYETIRGIKTVDKIDSSKMNSQEVQDKLCNVQNKIQMAKFGTQLLSQIYPMFEKKCADKIKACKKSCGEQVDGFKKEFINTYGFAQVEKKLYELGMGLKSSQQPMDDLIRLAKQCLFDDPVESFETISFKSSQEIENADGSDCYWDTKSASKIHYGSNNVNENREPLDEYGKKILASILYSAKSYYYTMEKPSDNFRFTEQEIVNCGHHPNRVLDTANKPGSPVPPTMMHVCRQAVKKAMENNSPAPPSIPINKTSQTQMGTASALTGGDLSSGTSPLLFDYNPEDSNKVNDILPPEGGYPEQGKKPPGWASSNAPGSGSGGSGGGGVSGSPGGSNMAGNSDNEGFGFGEAYPIGDILGGFSPGSDGYNSGGGGNSNGSRGVAVKETTKDTKGNDEFLVPDDLEEFDTGESIFNLASQRIQTFCSNHICQN